MTEAKKFLSLLQVAVSPDTALTVPAEIKILEMLGIINEPELEKAMDFTIALIPANTTATLHAFIALLGNIVKHHPKSNKHHHDEMSKLLKKFNDVPDGALTYGTFLPICELLLKAIYKQHSSLEHHE